MLGSGFIIPSTFNASPARTIRASSFSPACLPITFHQSLITQEYLGADHPFCTAAFCCPRFRRRRFAFACFALPRRHRSTARTALGRHDESVGDQFLRCSLSLLHLPDLLLARAHFAICPGWAGGWRPSRVARFSIDPLGKPPGRIFLYSQPWLALLIMLAIAARLVYGWWHTMHRGVPDEQHWFLSASGTQLSVAVAAGLIGYYLVYAIGVHVRVTRHEKRRRN